MKDGGPAFPLGITAEMESVGVSQEGMTLRDYFAAKALQAILSTDVRLLAEFKGLAEARGSKPHILIAKQAYLYAEAMLKQRDSKDTYDV